MVWDEPCMWVNGVLHAAAEPVLRADDLGFTVGEGVFETLLAVDGNAWLAARHYQRLTDGCARLGLTPPELPVLMDATARVLDHNRLTTGRARVRWTLSAGPPGCGATQVVSAQPALPAPAQVALWQVGFRRNERGALAGIKATAYAENKLALAEARRHGASEALLLNTRDEVCEGATSNVFAVIHGILTTPPLRSGCLPGITRALVLELAAKSGIPTAEKSIRPAELASAAEIFVTSSIAGIVPAGSLDGAPRPAERPLTTRLAGLLDEALREIR